MTAEVIQLFPVGADADDTVRHTVKALMSGRGVSAETVAPGVGMTVATLYRRLGGKGATQAFKAGEVASLARYFDVPVGQIYNGLGGTFVPPPTPDGGTALPRLDSNQQPFVNRFMQVTPPYPGRPRRFQPVLCPSVQTGEEAA